MDKPEPPKLHTEMTAQDVVDYLRAASGEVWSIGLWNGFRKANPEWRIPSALSPRGCSIMDLSGAELPCVDLSGASFVDADLSEAKLFAADLSGVNLLAADFRNANLAYADLTRAIVPEADFRGAQLSGANLSGANLTDANVCGTDLTGANLSDTNVADVRYRWSDLAGKCARTRCATCYGSSLFKRDVEDHAYIDALKVQLDYDAVLLAARLPETHENPRPFVWLRYRKAKLAILLFRVWGWIDYGHGLGSMARVAAVGCFLAMLFGAIYSIPGAVSFKDPTPHTWFTPFYYSVVTYTTLGFGDVFPASTGGQIAVMIEVVFGYLTLGVMVAILANTVARRA